MRVFNYNMNTIYNIKNETHQTGVTECTFQDIVEGKCFYWGNDEYRKIAPYHDYNAVKITESAQLFLERFIPSIIILHPYHTCAVAKTISQVFPGEYFLDPFDGTINQKLNNTKKYGDHLFVCLTTNTPFIYTHDCTVYMLKRISIEEFEYIYHE